MLFLSQDFLKVQGRGLQIGSVIFETIIFRIFATLELCRNTNSAVNRFYVLQQLRSLSVLPLRLVVN